MPCLQSILRASFRLFWNEWYLRPKLTRLATRFPGEGQLDSHFPPLWPLILSLCPFWSALHKPPLFCRRERGVNIRLFHLQQSFVKSHVDQDTKYFLKCACLSPKLQPSVASLIGRITIRQKRPSRSASQLPENTFKNFPLRMRRRSTLASGSFWGVWKNRRDQFPLAVCKSHAPYDTS